MAKPRQMALLRRPARRKRRDRLVLRRPQEGCGECMQYHRKRRLLPPGPQERHGRYQNMGNERCSHRGWNYLVNHGYAMTLCICCVNRLRRRGIWIENA